MLTYVDIYTLADSKNRMNKEQMMPLKKFAEANNISYRTAYRHWQNDLLEGIKLPTGTILIKGWKKEKEDKQDNTCIIFIRSISDNNDGVVERLKKIATINSLKISKIIIWKGYAFQTNPYMDDILNTNPNFIITNKLSDIYGTNYKIVDKVLSDIGITTLTTEDADDIESSIKGLLQSTTRMAKAAVGMHNHKKDISHYIDNLLK